ncbi:phosphoadenosine phosphosulfate reductase family protein [Cupriavidus basilensis]|uniref:phosphoadenosine phosphosulfate reductase domain-containing protein n=1 Tax=Cupriavidus basilensis TaxID=68895 RepID=UPI001F50E62A|nr:phosphoadenosine phosphosulfate reductase family protein [Cupriavidus basilensis]
MSIVHVVSMSGGKDSTATAILAIEQHRVAACRFVFADTGNEHQATYEYALTYLPAALGIKVDVVRADFADEFATKRANLARLAAGEPESAVYGRRQFMYQWTPAAAARALDLLHPTGNPYLDMCMLKGGFPSRKRQYCTDYLKTQPLTEYAVDLLDAGLAVWSWQGVRIDESDSRRDRLQGTGACGLSRWWAVVCSTTDQSCAGPHATSSKLTNWPVFSLTRCTSSFDVNR